ncbi:Uma2 family endonuclease [Stratiformator vulcanicus]|uniref:Putative restriction endonuclease domain-containing protein n=1 Tax=Stratiformator vulcanicus TaxID=2527980 RepID=A0A517QXJ7_9PLAN|nr:Uma2 family endonuclease [Stratiformator vulcanicus]QDT36317.1 hypothetical protein Pan189_06730 [Stratiformator vulcanicus]
MSTAIQQRLTPEDLLDMQDGDQYELVDGQLVEPAMSTESGWLASWIAFVLTGHVAENGHAWVCSETVQYRCFPDDPNRVRKPDVSVLLKSTRPQRPDREGFCLERPDIAVEIISPSDALLAIKEKLADYRAAKIPLIWLVHPDDLTIWVYRDAAKEPQYLEIDDQVDGGSVLPNFQKKVAELFPPELVQEFRLK